MRFTRLRHTLFESMIVSVTVLRWTQKCEVLHVKWKTLSPRLNTPSPREEWHRYPRYDPDYKTLEKPPISRDCGGAHPSVAVGGQSTRLAIHLSGKAQ